MDVDTLMGKYGIDMSDDVGRRNVFLSWMQEHLVARALGVKSDGRAGQHDIVFNDRPVECRIISPSQGKGINLTASWSQIERTPVMDFVFIMAARDLMSFAFLHIPDVSIGDFRPKTSPGTRARMIRSRVHDRVICLHGEIKQTKQGFNIAMTPL
jgi:hypothetical protein